MEEDASFCTWNGYTLVFIFSFQIRGEKHNESIRDIDVRAKGSSTKCGL